jgi:hypothetical protein
MGVMGGRSVVVSSCALFRLHDEEACHLGTNWLEFRPSRGSFLLEVRTGVMLDDNAQVPSLSGFIHVSAGFASPILFLESPERM